MTMHASADLRNVERTVMVWLAGAAALGAPTIPSGDEKFNTASADEFVRVSFQPMPEQRAGRVAATTHATRAAVLCVAECNAQGNGPGAGSVVDRVQGLASKVADALRYKSFPLYDYVTDPTGATAVSGVAVRFHSPPHIQHVAAADGWQRRIVSAEGHWFLRSEVPT